MQETVKQLILWGLGAVGVLALCFIWSLGKRGKITAVALALVGLVAAGIHISPKFDSKRKVVAFSVGKQIREGNAVANLPPDQIEWLLSTGDWDALDISRVDFFVANVGFEVQQLVRMRKDLETTDDLHETVMEEIHGPTWRVVLKEREEVQTEVVKEFDRVTGLLFDSIASGELERVPEQVAEFERQLAPLLRTQSDATTKWLNLSTSRANR